MIISLTYQIGENSQHKYFDTFEDLVKFIQKTMEVKQYESEYFEVGVYIGKEEEKVRGYSKKLSETK